MKRFQVGFVFEAHRLLCHSTLGLREVKKKKQNPSSVTVYLDFELYLFCHFGAKTVMELHREARQLEMIVGRLD